MAGKVCMDMVMVDLGQGRARRIGKGRRLRDAVGGRCDETADGLGTAQTADGLGTAQSDLTRVRSPFSLSRRDGGGATCRRSRSRLEGAEEPALDRLRGVVLTRRSWSEVSFVRPVMARRARPPACSGDGGPRKGRRLVVVAGLEPLRARRWMAPRWREEPISHVYRPRPTTAASCSSTPPAARAARSTDRCRNGLALAIASTRCAPPRPFLGVLRRLLPAVLGVDAELGVEDGAASEVSSSAQSTFFSTDPSMVGGWSSCRDRWPNRLLRVIIGEIRAVGWARRTTPVIRNGGGGQVVAPSTL